MSSSKQTNNSNSSSSPPSSGNSKSIINNDTIHLLLTPAAKRRPSVATTVGSESPTESLTASPESSSRNFVSSSSVEMMLTSPTSTAAFVGNAGDGGTSTSLYPIVTDLSDDVAADCCGAGCDATEWMQSMLLMASSHTDDSDIRVLMEDGGAANERCTTLEDEEEQETSRIRPRRDDSCNLSADELPPLPDISLSSNSRLQLQRATSGGPSPGTSSSPSRHRRLASAVTIASSPNHSPLAVLKPSHLKTHRRAYSEGAATLLLADNGSGESSEESAVSTTTLEHHRFEDLYVLTRPVRFVSVVGTLMHLFAGFGLIPRKFQ